MKNVLVILAEGFEEIEALCPIDTLRRCGANVTVAGLSSLSVVGAHGIKVECDTLLSSVESSSFDAVVLPGGMPGALNLQKSLSVKNIVLSTYASGALVCAICASPAFVLGPLGILEGKEATCYPGCESESPSVSFCSSRVVVSDNVVTAKGPGCAMEFSLEIVKILFGSSVSSSVSSSMIVQ